jgi:hypothetical protein
MHDNRLDEYSYNVGMEVKRQYDANPDSIAKFDPARLTGFAREVVGLLYHTGIAYNYDLTGLEINNIDPAVDFLRPLPKTSLVSLGLTGNFDRQRQNERSFTITDNFGDLVTKVRENYCTGHIAEDNYVYPIAGKVGIDRVVHDFLLLTLFANLGGTDTGKDPTKVSGPPTMVDQLQFQTTIGGAATPKIVFIPLGPAFSFSDASFPISASQHPSADRGPLSRQNRRKGNCRRTLGDLSRQLDHRLWRNSRAWRSASRRTIPGTEDFQTNRRGWTMR